MTWWTRLRHRWAGHPVEGEGAVQHFPRHPRAWCPGCRKWLDAEESGRLFARRALAVHDRKLREQEELG